MSYQTVSDIFAGSQNNYDFQKKDLGNASNGGSTSFGELVSFYKSENKGESRTFSSPVTSDSDYNSKVESESAKVTESNEKTHSDKSAAAKDSSSAESESRSGDVSEKNNSESVAQADNNQKNKDLENSVSEDGDKKQKCEESDKNLNAENNSEKQKVITDGRLGNIQFEEKSSGKEGIKDSNNEKKSKLTNRDFARIHELGSNAEKTESIVLSENENINVENLKKNKNGKVSKTSKNNSDEIKNKKLNNDELSEKLQKKESADDLTKNLNSYNNIASSSVADSSEKSEITDKDSDLDNISEISGNGKAKGQIFMDKDKKISVEDLRTSISDASNSDSDVDNDSKFKVSEPKLVNENTANITMEMKQNVNANVLSSNGQTAAANGSNFQAMLNNQIQQSAPEFVKAGNLVLKDNNQGTINLLLRPDELGNVKLHLSLDGKNISGHITVATKEALEVFKDNAETLREAFIKSGFESASFDVAYSGNNGAGQENAFQQQNDGKEFVARKVYENHSDNTDGEFDKIAEKNDKNKEYSINIVA